MQYTPSHTLCVVNLQVSSVPPNCNRRTDKQTSTAQCALRKPESDHLVLLRDRALQIIGF